MQVEVFLPLKVQYLSIVKPFVVISIHVYYNILPLAHKKTQRTQNKDFLTKHELFFQLITLPRSKTA